jgi:hypothetical protein
MRIIVKVLVVLAVIAGAGCAQLQTAQVKLNQDIQTLTVPDLQAAVAIASNPASPDPNPNHLACFQGLLNVINALPTTPPPAGTAPVGIASLVETDLISAGVSPITLPTFPTSVTTACNEVIGELTVKATADSLKLQAALAGTLTKLKLGHL